MAGKELRTDKGLGYRVHLSRPGASAGLAAVLP